MIPNACIEVHTTTEDRPSVPVWFAEVVILTRHLAATGLLEAFVKQVRLIRGCFGTYEPIDFLALLLGYAISGERTLADLFERLALFGSAFMGLFGRRCLPHRASALPLPRRCRSSLFRSLSYAFRAVQLSRRMDERFHWWQSSTDKDAVTLSLMWMLHAKPTDCATR